jgi:tRNA dimethylallyltransferase
LAERKPLVPVIVGPTAVGKTAVAVALRDHWPLVVISADSRQVYRRLDVGTAKPSAQDRALVPHLGLDLVEPGERYSAGRFARDAVGWLEDLPADRQPVIVGGTGFYVRALADGLFREPPLDRARRDRLREWCRATDALGTWAVRLDPAYRGGGRQQAARVVEVSLLTGRSLSWWQAQASSEGVMRPWYVRLTLPRAVLQRRIERRVGRMLRDGLIDEVRTLLGEGIPSDAPGLDGVGYRETVAHLAGRLAREDLASAIVVATRQYAKRQETWFRHQLLGHPVVTLDATDAPKLLAERIAELWEDRGH